MNNDDPRLLFIIKAVHCIAECGESLDYDEIKGLKLVLEQVIIAKREGL